MRPFQNVLVKTIKKKKKYYALKHSPQFFEKKNLNELN